MQVYWRRSKRGRRLILTGDSVDQEEEIGGVRETRQVFDTFAKTFEYDPGRAHKGFPTIEDAMQFVESFRPWELHEGTEGLEVGQEVILEAK